jgi:dihydrolipoamide dehydrogenase
MEYRETVLPKIQEKFGVHVTITDIMMKITGEAIRYHPVINTRWTDEGVLYLEDVHMGMAMALDEGLIVPVIRDINKKSLEEVAKDRVALIKKGRENKFLPDDITGSTFTLSGLGMFGLEQFTANINLPESAILAVGAIIDKPVAVNGQIVIKPMMNVTLSYDHRIIDGAQAGKFMRTLKSLIENPSFLHKTRIVIIGGGVGGYPAAITAARRGAEVTLIEKDLLGGTCLNWGCIPTKSLLQSGEVIRIIKESEVFGIECGNHKVNFQGIINRKNEVTQQMRSGVEKVLKAKQIRVIKGTATLIDSATVEILETGERIQSDKIIIATGSRPKELPIEGADGPNVWDSNEFLEMKSLPQSAIIIGGGVIGVEFAQILKSMGTDVTILEMMENLVPGTDKEIALALQESIVKDGIRVFTRVAVKRIGYEQGASVVAFEVEGERKEILAEKVVISVGRKPDLSLLNADKLGLAHKNGALVVDEHMETNISGIYAVGDVVGGMMLAHVAIAEGECAAKNAMGQKIKMNYRAIPSCIYTSPEVASVGLTEEEARKNFDINVGRFSFHGCGKALVLNQSYGMVKTISDRKSDKVLGVHIIGPRATDMIAEAVLGMTMEMTAEDLAHAVHPHPTLSEAVMESALSICGGAIHMP